MNDMSNLFKKVNCSAYYIKLKEEELLVKPIISSNKINITKVSYIKENKNFKGVVVGYETITITEEFTPILYYRDHQDTYSSSSWGYPGEVVKVARVFFKNNCSRLVPLDAMTEIKESEN